MVLAAALISLAVLAPQAPAQAAPQAASQGKVQTETQPASSDGSKPYSVDGVKRAMNGGDQPATDATPLVPDRLGYRMSLEVRSATWDPCSLVATGCPCVWGGVANPTWHDQFIAMTGPPDYLVPYTGMSNSQKLQGVASSIVFGLVIQAVVSLVYDQVVEIKYERKQQRVEKVRAEIRAELDELQRVNAPLRAPGQTPVR